MKKTGICLLLALTALAGCGGTSSTNSSHTTGTSYELSKNDVSTIAGAAGATGATGIADGVGTASRFNNPIGITMSKDKLSIYMTDYASSTIRQMVLSTGQVTTIAGKAGVSGSANGNGTAATFYHPHDIVTDGTNLYVADAGNHTIRKIVIATKEVTTLAGSAGVTGKADATGAVATFNNPTGLTLSGATLYVTDTNNNTIRRVDTSSGIVTTIAGTAGSAGSANGTGIAATFNTPAGITTDGTNLYVCDFGNNMIRQIVISSNAVSTLAGSTNYYGSADGIGAKASFYAPNGITTDGTNLYVTDANNHIVRKIAIATGTVTTVAGLAATLGSSDGTGSFARFYFPVGIAYTSDGTNSSLYIADEGNSTIRKIK